MTSTNAGLLKTAGEQNGEKMVGSKWHTMQTFLQNGMGKAQE